MSKIPPQRTKALKEIFGLIYCYHRKTFLAKIGYNYGCAIYFT